ncbi:MAG: LysM peptidoglycan-binding domain-containing protein, partial [Betaproteobacteria bacterium]|nr:LysM peptidoglycan-binding domain-containing protein [Betaproteobacteria bacterium]
MSWRLVAATVALPLLLSACATSLTPAPVSDRSVGRTAPAPGTALPGSGAPAGPFADKAGQQGYYTVKPGDTLMRIALDSGQAWRDIARWNNMDNPNVLEVGQVLRVAPPAG